MSEGNTQRIYLTCGSIFLLIFCFVTAIGIVTLGPGTHLEVISVIVLTVSMAVLLFNSTMLFGSNGGSTILKAGKLLLWLSFFLIEGAVVVCIVSMVSNS